MISPFTFNAGCVHRHPMNCDYRVNLLAALRQHFGSRKMRWCANRFPFASRDSDLPK